MGWGYAVFMCSSGPVLGDPEVASAGVNLSMASQFYSARSEGGGSG